MKKMVKKTVITEITWMKNATLAYFSHDNRNCSFTWREAVKKDTREIKEAVNASKTKKCPNCPGNKCSPSNFMLMGITAGKLFSLAAFYHPYTWRGTLIICHRN